MTIQIVLADDEVLARQKLRLLLREQTDCEVVGECATAAETVALVRAAHPDVVFLDIRMPDMDGFDVVDALSAEPDVHHAAHRVHNRLRPVRGASLRRPCRGLSAEAVRRRAVADDPEAHPRAGAAADPRRTAKRTANAIRAELFSNPKGRILFLPVSEIRWIAAEENYVRICYGE